MQEPTRRAGGGAPRMSASTAGCTRALLALALAAALTVRHAAGQTDAFQHDRPGRPTVDSVHVKTVGVACSSPYTLTQLTSPVFDSYLAALSNVFTPTAPLLLSAKCAAPLPAVRPRLGLPVQARAVLVRHRAVAAQCQLCSPVGTSDLS